MATIEQLRHAIAKISRQPVSAAFDQTAGGAAHPQVLPFGLPALDEALGGGLRRGALHEIMPAKPLDIGTATGFAVTIAARVSGGGDDNGPVVWIQQRYGMVENGRLYGTGLQQCGIAADALLAVRVEKPGDVLWAMEEALSLGIALVVGEMPPGRPVSLTSTRRLSLAAASGGGTGVLLCQPPSMAPSAALTRWQVAAASSRQDRLGGLGLPCFDLSLNKNRHGACGRWLVHWNAHEHQFLTEPQLLASEQLAGQALPRGLVSVPPDRPHRTGLAPSRRDATAGAGHYRIAS